MSARPNCKTARYGSTHWKNTITMPPLKVIRVAKNNDKGNATMPKFDIRCNTERVLVVEADDEQAAREIAEQTDFSDWDSLDSPYAIKVIDNSDQPVETVHQLEAAYKLRLDGQLFRRQRQLLSKILDAVSR
jgi:hypothetical protein